MGFEERRDKENGTRGSLGREQFERDFEACKLGVLIQELRKEKQLTQQQLAARCSTTKHYISRIENDASDIRLSTLMRIIQQGLGAKLTLQLEYGRSTGQTGTYRIIR